MRIHRVKDGENVSDIAREHAVSPAKIIENNDLRADGRPTVGEELLILTPTRTYTVSGADTLERICRRFCLKSADIICKNPSLLGGKSVYPGQILTLKCDTPPYGSAFMHGYYYPGTTEEKLCAVLPYLTYVSVCAGRVERDDVKLLFDDSAAVKRVRESGRIPLLHIFSDGEIYALDKSVTDTAILLAKARGYAGINLSCAAIKDAGRHSEFLCRFKDELNEYDLLLFTERDMNAEADITDVCDGTILSYGKAHLPSPPTFDEGERAIFSEYAGRHAGEKAYIELSPFAFSRNDFMLKETAVKIARTGRCRIEFDEGTKLCRFGYNRYSGGRKEEAEVVYESLENIKAKLGLVSELGLMGVSVDIMRVPLNYLLMFDSFFRSKHR